MTAFDGAPRAGRQALMFVGAVLFDTFYTLIVTSQFVGLTQDASRDSA
jgi:hypothetical protein